MSWKNEILNVDLDLWIHDNKEFKKGIFSIYDSLIHKCLPYYKINVLPTPNTYLSIKEVANILWESYNPCNPNTQNLPIGSYIIATTDEIKNSVNLYGLKSIAIKTSSNKIYIAFAGTDIFKYADIKDDIRIIFGFPPCKIEAIKYFVKHVGDKIGGLENFFKSDIIFCGHSLGGVLAEIAMLLIYQSKHDYQDVINGNVQIVTIENPGSYKVLKHLLSKGKFPAIDEYKFEELAGKCTTYNSKQNFINTLGTQFANKNTFLQVNNKKVIEEVTTVESNEHSNKICSLNKNFLGYFELCMSYILSPIKKFYSSYLLIKEFLKDHGLTNYIDDATSFFLPVEQFKGPNNQIILHQSVLELLKNITSTGKDIAIIKDDINVNSNCGLFSYVELYEYSCKDLELIDLNDKDTKIYSEN